jgi:formate dehydrogenase assembly factor FdhD
MLSHTQIKNFACGICGDKFTQKSNRNTHEQWVCGKEKIACTDCGKLFSGPTNLEHHFSKTHKMHPPVECKICGISLRGDLKRHNLTEKHINAVEKLRLYEEDDEEYRKERKEALAQLLKALE